MDPRSLALFVILIALSSFFSASETAFTAIPLHRASAFLRDKLAGSTALYKLKLNPERMLIAILIGNNIVNIFAASLATVISLDIAAKINFEGTAIITVSTIVVTILVLLFGEIFPKTFATRHADRISLLIAPFYTFLIKLLFPIVRILERMMKGISKKEKKNQVSESDLEAFIDLSRKSGILDADEGQMINKLLNFDELTAEEVMTPRIKIKALDDSKTLDEAIAILTDYHFSRIPVYHQHVDAIDRVVMIKELLRLKKTKSWETPISELPLTPIMKVPRSQPIDSLLEKFQKTHKHIAVVVDEYGGVEGIVSLEDIIEEVFGEIQDEQDEEVSTIKTTESWALICQSYVRMDEVLSELSLHFDNLGLEDEFESESLSYFITSYLERFPVVGEQIRIPLHFHEDLDAQQNKDLLLKVLWVKKNIVWEIEVAIQDREKN